MTKSNGFFTLHRRLFEDVLWLSGTLVQKALMVLCIGKAGFKQKEWIWKGKKFNTKRGQFITSLNSLKKEIGKECSIKNIRTALVNLEKYGFLANESAKTGRLITIVNYSKYQDLKTKVAKQVAKRWQRGGKEVATTNNDNNDIISSSKPKKVFDQESVEYKLSSHLWKKIKERNPDHKEPNLQLWAKHIDLMIRIDKKDPEKIKQIINWCQADSFWYANILSTQKLRKQFDQLVLKSIAKKGSGKNESTFRA